MFDIARVLCILVIVAFHHMTDYIRNGVELRDGYGWLVTSSLACFTFISGYFLGKKELDCKSFFVSRLKRFFIPLVLTSVLLSFGGWFDSIWQFLFTITGLSCFFLPQPSTLWFFSMMIVFYFLTPYLSQRNGPAKTLIHGAVCMGVFLLLFHFNMLDIRLLYYFPFYIAGILITGMTVLRLVRDVRITVLCILILCVMTNLSTHESYPDLAVINASGVLLIMTISFYIGKYSTRRIKSMFECLSYSSMFAYLFHRGIYGMAGLFYKHFLHEPYLPVHIIPAVLVTIFAVSYFAQKTYDLLITDFSNRKHYVS